jgi:hypothetical protein
MQYDPIKSIIRVNVTPDFIRRRYNCEQDTDKK